MFKTALLNEKKEYERFSYINQSKSSVCEIKENILEQFDIIIDKMWLLILNINT